MPDSSYRLNAFLSLVLLPLANATGHLAPGVGALWAAVGRPLVDYPVLLLTFSVHTLIDSYDKFKDMPRHALPSTRLWLMWVGSLLALALGTTYQCGFDVAKRLLFFLGLELLWPTPSIPFYSRSKKGLRLVKLKDVFGAGKSVFCGFCAGWMDVNPATVRACGLYPSLCSPKDVRLRSLAYSVLYNFLRETVCDARDIAEDEKEGVMTLPIALGGRRGRTMLLLAVTVVLGDIVITGDLGMESLLRATLALGMSHVVLTQPRENGLAWASLALFLLLPVLWAQVRLVDSFVVS